MVPGPDQYNSTDKFPPVLKSMNTFIMQGFSLGSETALETVSSQSILQGNLQY